MLGLRTILKTKSNSVQVKIPDTMKNRYLEIIILPVPLEKNTEEYEFWSEKELQELGKLNLTAPVKDNEDYSKW